MTLHIINGGFGLGLGLELTPWTHRTHKDTRFQIQFFPWAGTKSYKAVINGYNSSTCCDSDIVSVRPQNFPLRYCPIRTNGRTHVVRPRNQSISIDKYQSH